MKFVRRDLMDPAGSCEVLEIVKTDRPYYSVWLDAHVPYLVQVTWSNDSGLFDLDGERLNHLPDQWEVAHDIPSDILQAVEEGWAGGNYEIKLATRNNWKCV